MILGAKRTRVEIDLNSKTAEGWVRVPIRYAEGPVGQHMKLVAYQDGTAWPAEVTAVEGRFLYLSVAWDDFVDDGPEALQDSFSVSFGDAVAEPVGAHGFHATKAGGLLTVA